MEAIRIHRTGGPEVLTYEQVETPTPRDGEALVKIEASGVNYIDTYHRKGLYPVSFPFIPGQEGAGTVESVGPGVREVKPGDRVVYAMHPHSYATHVVVPETKLVPLPVGVTAAQGAAILLQGMTAHFLLHSAYPVKAGDTILVHAAAGGVGLILVQLAKQLGVRVLGTVSTEEKAVLAREAGADEVIIYTKEDFASKVRALTGGTGVAVVYDGVGKDTFEGSLNSLRRRGYMVLFGQSSGPVPPFNPNILNGKGSLYLTRPTLGDYVQSRAELLERAGDILTLLAAGRLNLRIDSTFTLKEAAEAHRKLESRTTMGKIILTP